MRPEDIIADRYRLVGLLGQGGMGSVWEATHIVTRKRVALKLLRRDDADTVAKERMLREARAACAISHPNVVAIHDVLELPDGSPALVMDLLHGETLRARLEREGPLDFAFAKRVVLDLLGALSAAHALGVVHRDLKPENLFLETPGDTVKILDFGIAKLFVTGSSGENVTLTETGAMIGTPHYMAPEQAFGDSDIDARADVFAVGVILYECLTRARPTEGDNLGQVLRNLAQGKMVRLATRLPGAPSDLLSAVDRALAHDRDQRFASAAEFQSALEQIGRVSALPVDDAAARAEDTVPSKRRRARSLAIVIAILAAIGGTWALSLSSRVGPEPAAPSRTSAVPNPSTVSVPSAGPVPSSEDIAKPTLSASHRAVVTPSPRSSPPAHPSPARTPGAPATSPAPHGPTLIDKPPF